MQEIPYGLDIDYVPRSNANESHLLRQGICKRCWQNIFDTSVYAEMWLNERHHACFTVSFEDLGISAQIGCTWCRLLKTHVDHMMRSWVILDPEACLLVAMTHQRCHDLRVTPAGSFDFGVIIEIPLSPRAVKLRSSQHAQDKDWDEDWASEPLLRALKFDVFTHSSDPAAKVVPTREIQPVVHSPKAITEAKRWIDSCDDHVDCSTTSDVLLPFRVIDVLPIFGKPKPRLVVTNGLRGRYNTLSYCWGTQKTVLTKKNLAQFQKGIDLSTLSKTVQDAIEITISLDIQYLWIDAICILQDSPQDKALEISRMASIYQSSYITIVAASAKNADEGFLLPRNAPSLATTIAFMHNGFHAGTVNIRRRVIIREGAWGTDPSPPPDPVDSRAWTLQEQLLSQRLLVYSTDTLQWRCKGVVANLGSSRYVPQPDKRRWSTSSATFIRPDPVPLLLNRETSDVYSGVENLAHDEGEDIAMSEKPSTDPIRQQAAEHRRLQKLHTQWAHLIEKYSLRSMTYASDKLLALAGIADKFGDALRTKYVAGFWEDHMLEYLMWQPETGATRSSLYRAPSWSWASLDGMIAWDYDIVTGFGQSGHRAYHCRILQCQVTLKNQLLPYGEVNGGHIELSAVMRRAWYGDPLPHGELYWLEDASTLGKQLEDVRNSVFRRPQTQSKRTSSDPPTYGTVDIRLPGERTSWYNGEVFCVALWANLHRWQSCQRIKGLMLTHKGTTIYERIGYFESSARNFDRNPMQTITII